MHKTCSTQEIHTKTLLKKVFVEHACVVLKLIQLEENRVQWTSFVLKAVNINVTYKQGIYRKAE
jgi:hypothetical protein